MQCFLNQTTNTTMLQLHILCNFRLFIAALLFCGSFCSKNSLLKTAIFCHSIYVILLFCYNSSPNYVSTLDPWMYTCQKDYLGQDEACVRMKTPGKVNGGVSFAECKLTCGLDLQVWPKINGDSNKMKVACFAIFCLVVKVRILTLYFTITH